MKIPAEQGYMIVPHVAITRTKYSMNNNYGSIRSSEVVKYFSSALSDISRIGYNLSFPMYTMVQEPNNGSILLFV